MKLNIMQKVVLWVLNELDGINYRIERFINKLTGKRTDFAYRQYIEVFIELLREFTAYPKECLADKELFSYWLGHFKDIKTIR